MLEENSNILYRVRDRQLYGTDLTDISWNGGYLEGDTLKVFRSGDGYYQLDLRTGQETRLADAQMEHSFCHIMAPNCILESTVLNVAYLRDEVLETRQLHPVEEHTMRFFDGELWLDVALPEEVQKAQGGESLTPIALTLDRILFSFKDISDVMNEDPVALYQILLNTDSPTLEYLGTIG